MNSNFQNRSIERMYELDEEELILILGENISSSNEFAVSPFGKDYIKLSKQWLGENKRKICVSLSQSGIRETLLENNDEKLTLVAAIIDVLLPILGLPIGGVVSVSVLIVKYGVKYFCEEK